MTLHYDISDVAPYINWVYFYFAWQVKEEDEQRRLRCEAEQMLQALEGRYRTHALLRLCDAHSEGDDIVLDDGTAIPCLRQQTGSTCLCLADFIDPKGRSAVGSRIGLFAASVDRGMEVDFDDDPYQKMMAQLLADRLAEATAERLHQQVRTELWGYARDEQLSIGDLHQEHFQGIRPAVGYPSLPDASLNFLLDRLLGFGEIGITLTESGAMRPHASVSGLMMDHPDARYFSIGHIGDDQLHDYARRRGMAVGEMRRFLSANL